MLFISRPIKPVFVPAAKKTKVPKCSRGGGRGGGGGSCAIRGGAGRGSRGRGDGVSGRGSHTYKKNGNGAGSSGIQGAVVPETQEVGIGNSCGISDSHEAGDSHGADEILALGSFNSQLVRSFLYLL